MNFTDEIKKGAIYKITVPLPPISKKNSQRILFNPHKRGGFCKSLYNGCRFRYVGVPFIAPSAKYEQYALHARGFIRRIDSIDFPVTVKCLFYMPTRRKVDLTNLLESIDDILVSCGVLADDNYTILTSHDGSRVLYDPKEPRTEIYISKVKNET